jgi:UDP-glucose 4-epimerase
MLSKNSLKEILDLVRESKGSFFISQGSTPKIAVLDYDTYQKLAHSGAQETNSPLKTAKQQQKILVTGGAGRLGSIFVRSLMSLGYSVVVVDNLSTGSLDVLPEGIDFVQADLRDLQSLKDIFSEYTVDAVVHLAALSSHQESFESPETYFVNNVEGGFSLLKAMTDAGVSRLVWPTGQPTSSPLSQAQAVFQNAIDFYGKAFGLQATILEMPAVALPSHIANGFESQALLADDPVAAVLQAVVLHEETIAMPYVGDSTRDGTPEVNVIAAADAITALVHAVEISSTGNGMYIVDSVQATIAGLVDSVIEQTHKMLPTSRIAPGLLWQPNTVKRVAALPKLSTTGWQLAHNDLTKVIAQTYALPNPQAVSQAETAGEAKPQEMPLAQKFEPAEQPAKTYAEPISLSDLLAGKVVPFIKPHKH